MDDRYPEWARQLFAWLPVSPQVVLTGRVDDQHVAPLPSGHVAAPTTPEIVADCLRQRGFPLVLGWDPLRGAVTRYEERDNDGAGFLSANVRGQTPPAVLTTLITAVVTAPRRTGLVIQSAPRLAPNQDNEALNIFYARARELAVSVMARVLEDERSTRREPVYNTVVWTVGKEAELPHWLVAAEGVRIISIPDTTVATRRPAAELSAFRLPGFAALDDRMRREVVDRFANETAGMSVTETLRVVPLARERGIAAGDVGDAVRFLRSGVARSPWREPDLRQRIVGDPVRGVAGAEETLNDKVKGQTRAVRKAMSILARATLGLSGAHAEGHPTRPQGVMFLAGPTGSGKTELAKQIATVVFGREEAMVRFDMSEYAAEQNEARLIGSPPGFVGHGAGGELTNAVRRNPFSLLLFDEIEKAHPRILDKFLQILEDGRLTDGSGNTVHFTETLIVFTSNMGIYRRSDPQDDKSPLVRNVDPGDDYATIERTVREAIKSEFTEIQRPELLNRIGDNIVVFDFIAPEVACAIIDRNLDTLGRRLAAAGYHTTFGDRVRQKLYAEAAETENLAFGGRQMNNIVESLVLDPLALHLLAREPGPVTVVELTETLLKDDTVVREVVLR